MFWSKKPKPKEVLRDWLSTPAHNISRANRALPVVDDGIRALQRGAGLACKKGCDWCCRQAVTVSPQEAIWLARWMRDALPPDSLARLSERVQGAAEETRNMTMAERAQAAIPCPLLEDGKCAVYPARPMECRNANSADVSYCRAAALAPDSVPGIPTHQATHQWGTQFMEALHATAIAHQLDASPLDHIAALSIALNDPATEEQWLSGEAVFLSARRRVTNEELEKLLAFRMGMLKS